MEELFEELKHHELEEVHFTAENYKVIFLGVWRLNPVIVGIYYLL